MKKLRIRIPKSVEAVLALHNHCISDEAIFASLGKTFRIAGELSEDGNAKPLVKHSHPAHGYWFPKELIS